MTAGGPRRAVLGLVMVAAACAPAAEGGPGESNARDAARDSVRAMVSSIPGALAERGPLAWLEFFQQTAPFSMASDGRIVFPNLDSVRAFLDRFAPTIRTIELRWSDLDVDVVAPDAAYVTARFAETLVDTADGRVDMNGVFTGLVGSGPDGWRFLRMHWSTGGNAP